jgi:hypothetical protein
MGFDKVMGIETPAKGGYEAIAFGHSAGCDPLYTGLGSLDCGGAAVQSCPVPATDIFCIHWHGHRPIRRCTCRRDHIGNSSSGTLTLTVKGKTFVEGTYSCSSSGCAFTGTMAGKHVAADTTPGLSGVG